MALLAHCLLYYPIWGEGREWDDRAYIANKLSKAVKRKKFKGHASFTFRGKTYRISDSNLESAHQTACGVFGTWGCEGLKAIYGNQLVSFVPVPCHDCTVEKPKRGVTDDLVDALVRAAQRVNLRANTLDVLRWKQKLVPARKGGPRRPDILYPFVEVIDNVAGATCVLVDDILTTGGHLRACSAALRRHSGIAANALCAGRTWNEDQMPDDILSVPDESLADYAPP